jgi:hypothetical protein
MVVSKVNAPIKRLNTAVSPAVIEFYPQAIANRQSGNICNNTPVIIP